MTKLTLKPCPRCGGPGEIREDYDAQAWSGRYYARCIGAGCGLLSPHFETVALTAAWWNERPGEQVQARLCPSVSSHGFRCQVSEFHLGPHQNGGCQWWDADATIQPEPTRNAAEPPTEPWRCHECGKEQHGRDSFGYVCDACHAAAHAETPTEPSPHQCSYGGEHWTESAWVRRRQLCGEQGWLCDRCKLDRLGRYFTSVNMRLAAIAQSISPPSTVPQKESEQ